MTDHTTSTAASTASGSNARNDLPPRGLAVRSLAEAIGSFLVILAGVGATITVSDTALQPTLVFGFAVVAAMIAFGHVSGGHFNPAITVGSVVAGRTGVRDGALYVVAQVLGGVAAAALTWLVLSANAQLTDISNFFSAASNGYADHSPVQFPLSSAFLLEVVATALLVAVFLGAGSTRARRDLAPFAVGLTYTGLLTFVLPVTNGGLNPARSTASAIFAEPWALEQLWLFWAAPVVGALIAGLMYRGVESVSRAAVVTSSEDVDEDPADATDTSRAAAASQPASPVVPSAASSADPFVGKPGAAPVRGEDRPSEARQRADERADGDAATFFETTSDTAPDGGFGQDREDPKR